MAEKKTDKEEMGPKKEKLTISLKPPKAAKPQSGFIDMIKEQAGTDLTGGINPLGPSLGANYNLGSADIGVRASAPWEKRMVTNPNENLRSRGSQFVKGAPDLEKARANIYAKNLMDRRLGLSGTIGRDKNWNVSANYKPTDSTEIMAMRDNNKNYNVGINQKINDNLTLKAAYNSERGPSAMLQASGFRDEKKKRDMLNAYIQAKRGKEGLYAGVGLNYKF